MTKDSNFLGSSQEDPPLCRKGKFMEGAPILLRLAENTIVVSNRKANKTNKTKKAKKVKSGASEC